MAKNNEKGYALVVVLLTITVFMLLALSFMGHSANSMKQNKIIETKTQSVSLAEMGVTYSKQLIQNAYLTNKKAVDDEINKLILAEMNSPTKSNYAQLAASKMNQILMNNFKPLNKTIDGTNTASFSIKNIISNLDQQNQIHIQFDSVGMVASKTTTLNATMDFLISEKKPDELGTGGGSGTLVPKFNEVPKPDGSCTYPRTNCTPLLVTGSQTILLGNGNNSNNLNSRTIYSTENLNFGGNNVNNVSNTKIHSEGSLSVNINMQNVDASIIETKGAASFGSQLKLLHSRMLIGGKPTLSSNLALHVLGHLTLSSGSFAYIDGNVRLDKSPFVTNSTMCVTGTLTIQGMDLTSRPPSGIYTPSHKDFDNKCGKGPSTTELDWGNMKPKMNVDYQY